LACPNRCEHDRRRSRERPRTRSVSGRSQAMPGVAVGTSPLSECRDLRQLDDLLTDCENVTVLHLWHDAELYDAKLYEVDRDADRVATALVALEINDDGPTVAHWPTPRTEHSDGNTQRTNLQEQLDGRHHAIGVQCTRER